MTTRFKLIALIALASAGLLFSGYLSAVKLFTDTCALNETCPYFLGYPACWYGFGMYLAMWLVIFLGFLRKARLAAAFGIVSVVSLAGILFAGKFFIDELLGGKLTGKLGLSSCTYGLIFYIAIFLIALNAWRERRSSMLE